MSFRFFPALLRATLGAAGILIAVLGAVPLVLATTSTPPATVMMWLVSVAITFFAGAMALWCFVMALDPDL